MRTTKAKTKVVVSVLALAGLAVFSLFAVGGSLEPSAPPGPTMKTLDEVEPRVPIHASDLPLTITEPNSYYLVEDVNFEPNNVHAITIECNDVTIDLMGFTLTGPDSGTKSGIYMNGRTNVEVCNGTVRDFGYGIHEASFAGNQHRIINVRAMSNQTYGIRLYGRSHLVKDCTVAHNPQYGIYVYYGSTVTGSIAYDNGLVGIYTGSGCTVTGNTAFENGISVGNGYGIYTSSGCTVTGNTAYHNSSYGIYADQGCNVTGNTASCNTGDGITVSGLCRVVDNTCYYNGYLAGDGGGIHATGSQNRIEGNNVTDSDRGIDVDSANNLIVKNSASGNTTNYDIAANNAVGDILDFTSGGTITSSNPWANFEY